MVKNLSHRHIHPNGYIPLITGLYIQNLLFEKDGNEWVSHSNVYGSHTKQEINYFLNMLNYKLYNSNRNYYENLFIFNNIGIINEIQVHFNNIQFIFEIKNGKITFDKSLKTNNIEIFKEVYSWLINLYDDYNGEIEGFYENQNNKIKNYLTESGFDIKTLIYYKNNFHLNFGVIKIDKNLGFLLSPNGLCYFNENDEQGFEISIIVSIIKTLQKNNNFFPENKFTNYIK